MRRRPAPQPATRGFTLLEVLVALVVLGFLMAGLAEGVRAGLALRQAQARRLDETAGLDASMRLLRRILTDLPTVPAGNRLITDETGAAIKGEADYVRFVGNLPTGIGSARLADMTLHVVKHELLLDWRPHRHERPLGGRPPPTASVLLSGVDAVQLAYWGSPVKGQPAAWQARWDALRAPELIRVRLIFPKHDPRRWPDLIAASQSP